MEVSISEKKLKRGVSYPFRFNFLSTSKETTSISVFKCEFLSHIISLDSSFELSPGRGKCSTNLFWKFAVEVKQPTQSSELMIRPKNDAPLGLYALNFLFSDFGLPTNILSEPTMIEVVP
jgi:hypothetical protein